MLSAVTRAFRVKAAIVLAAAYALCTLAPAAAFAFSDNPAVVHCLTEGHVGVHGESSKHDHGGKPHVHADSTAEHHHHDDGAAPPSAADDKANVASCCGLFSVVAIPGEPGVRLGLHGPASTVISILGEALSGRGPDRINRPPIA